ncbi:replication-relaxation family protein [Acidiferrimicrobium sp. IK]|nr:replication-relaxation family protein [Acidiferrimicrobium sp. IK]
MGRDDRLYELAGRLTERDRRICRLLLDHRVLTTAQVADIGFDSTRKAQARLSVLHAVGVVDRFRLRSWSGTSPYHFTLGPAGAAGVAAERGVTVADLGWHKETATALATNRQLTHLVGCNGVLCALIRNARTRPGCALDQWWSARRCAAAWGEIVRPDAVCRLGRARRPPAVLLRVRHRHRDPPPPRPQARRLRPPRPDRRPCHLGPRRLPLTRPGNRRLTGAAPPRRPRRHRRHRAAYRPGRPGVAGDRRPPPTGPAGRSRPPEPHPRGRRRYRAAGVTLPRVAQDQHDAGSQLPPGATLERGDLVFFGGGPQDVSHVPICGIYVRTQGGRAVMVEAPHTGADVRVEPFLTTMGASIGGGDIVVGFTRLALLGG